MTRHNLLPLPPRPGGPRWSLLSKKISGRSQNSIKNRWHATQRKIQRLEARLKRKAQRETLELSKDGSRNKAAASTSA